ncbi:MAG: penicillin-insensitive murein endopeptidase [Deltaproteobacteria bacterium]|nr:penicillin-insensitive murein endopeptidase [Deltaproteobacteria bacterium]
MERVKYRRVLYYALILPAVFAVSTSLFIPRCKALTASYGQPWHGYLVNGVRFPDMFPGYRLLFKNNTYTTPELAGAVLDAIQAVRARFPGTCDLVIGDFSRKGGGFFEGHVSHQNGRDVDIGFYAKDNRPLINLIPMNRDNLDAAKTFYLIQCLVASQRVQYIFIGRSIQKILYDYGRSQGYSLAYLNRLFGEVPGALAENWPGHINHMCVRFFTPWSTLAAHIPPYEHRTRSIIAVAQRSYMPKKIEYFVTGRERGLAQLARSFGVTESELCRWNHISPFSVLVPGSCLLYYKRSFQSGPVELASSLEPGYIAQLAAPGVRLASFQPQSEPTTLSDAGYAENDVRVETREPSETAARPVSTFRGHRHRTARRETKRSTAPRGAFYVVKYKGTLRNVSRTGVPLASLCRLNHIGINIPLKPGWAIRLPELHSAAPSRASICFASNPRKRSTTTAYYRVIYGGTLRDVSKRTGLSLAVLCRLNRLGPDARLRRGQLVKLARVNLPVRPSFGRASCSLRRPAERRAAIKHEAYRKRVHRVVVRRISYRHRKRTRLVRKVIFLGQRESE